MAATASTEHSCWLAQLLCCVKFSRNKRKRQPIKMLGRSSGNHDWLLANASDCVWMETGPNRAALIIEWVTDMRYAQYIHWCVVWTTAISARDFECCDLWEDAPLARRLNCFSAHVTLTVIYTVVHTAMCVLSPVSTSRVDRPFDEGQHRRNASVQVSNDLCLKVS